MELLNQFQGFIGSIGFGFFFFLFYHPLFLFFDKVSVFIKVPINIIIFIGTTYLYFLFLINFTYGILNIFYPFCIVTGLILYRLFYYYYFNNFYLAIFAKISKSIKLKTKKLFDIIKSSKRRKKKDGKWIKNKKQNN